MNSNLLLAVKAKVFSFMLAAGNPFDGAGNLASDFQGNFVKVSKLFSIIVAVVGTAAIVGGIVTWLFDTSRGWFGG